MQHYPISNQKVLKFNSYFIRVQRKMSDLDRHEKVLVESLVMMMETEMKKLPRKIRMMTLEQCNNVGVEKNERVSFAVAQVYLFCFDLIGLESN